MMENVFGVDVAKAWIDVAGPDGYQRVSNNELPGFAQAVRAVRGVVVFEASGGCEAPLKLGRGPAGSSCPEASDPKPAHWLARVRSGAGHGHRASDCSSSIWRGVSM